MDFNQQAWAQFAATGRVEDYLRFRMQAESQNKPGAGGITSCA